MLTHVVSELVNEKWAADWLVARLGTPYSYCGARKAFLEAVVNDETQEITIGQIVKWLESNSDPTTVQMLYRLCRIYGDHKFSQTIQMALNRVLRVKVSYPIMAWQDGICTTIYVGKRKPKRTTGLTVERLSDNASLAVLWPPNKVLHKLLVAYLKNEAVRIPKK